MKKTLSTFALLGLVKLWTDALQKLGIAPLDATGEAGVQEGKLKSHTTTLRLSRSKANGGRTGSPRPDRAQAGHADGPTYMVQASYDRAARVAGRTGVNASCTPVPRCQTQEALAG